MEETNEQLTRTENDEVHNEIQLISSIYFLFECQQSIEVLFGSRKKTKKLPAKGSVHC